MQKYILCLKFQNIIYLQTGKNSEKMLYFFLEEQHNFSDEIHAGYFSPSAMDSG